MGEITSGISILLGSAVVSTIITTIFNQYNNRKNNTLKYITEERKKWRDTIRLISEKIQACEFSGQDEKNIEKYLVELELNINSCGWGNKKDIKEDAYNFRIHALNLIYNRIIKMISKRRFTICYMS